MTNKCEYATKCEYGDKRDYRANNGSASLMISASNTKLIVTVELMGSASRSVRSHRAAACRHQRDVKAGENRIVNTVGHIGYRRKTHRRTSKTDLVEAASRVAERAVEVESERRNDADALSLRSTRKERAPVAGNRLKSNESSDRGGQLSSHRSRARGDGHSNRHRALESSMFKYSYAQLMPAA